MRSLPDAILVSTWLHFDTKKLSKSHLGGVLGRLRRALRRLGGVSERLGGVLGRLGASWGHLGSVLGHLGSVLGRLGGLLGLSQGPRRTTSKCDAERRRVDAYRTPPPASPGKQHQKNLANSKQETGIGCSDTPSARGPANYV